MKTKRHKGENMKITIETGDITASHTDSIVNPANSGLQRGGGACGAIFDAVEDAAGREAYDRLTAACNAIGHCPTGKAVITPSFGLNAPFIIHAVGPIWYGREKSKLTSPLTEQEKSHVEELASAYRAILGVCHSQNLNSVTIPAISTGIFNFPDELAAAIAVKVCSEEAGDAAVTLIGFSSGSTSTLRNAPTPKASALLEGLTF
jgi:O-acetyl-ADP-ribose deacetylase (regulator of RNase III)